MSAISKQWIVDLLKGDESPLALTISELAKARIEIEEAQDKVEFGTIVMFPHCCLDAEGTAKPIEELAERVGLTLEESATDEGFVYFNARIK